MTKPVQSTGYPGLDENVEAMIEDGWTYEELRVDEGRVLLLTRGDDRVRLSVAAATTLGLSTIGGLRAYIGVTTPKAEFQKKNRLGEWMPAPADDAPTEK